MKRDALQDAARALGAGLLILFALCAVIATGIRGADAAAPASPWGDYEGAVKGAFLRSEGQAFAAITEAVESLPEIARDGFVKAVIVGLGLAATAPETLEGGNIKPEDQRRLRDALSDYANVDELIAEIEKNAVAKPVETVDDSEPVEAEAEAVPEPEPVEGNRGVVLVVPREAIEPVEAANP